MSEEQGKTAGESVARAHARGNGSWAPFTSETGRAAAQLSKGVKKPRSLMSAVAKVLRLPADDGGEGTNLDMIGRALVNKCREGDVAAIKLVLERRDGALPKTVHHEHGLARELIVRPDGDARGLPAQLGDGSQSHCDSATYHPLSDAEGEKSA